MPNGRAVDLRFLLEVWVRNVEGPLGIQQQTASRVSGRIVGVGLVHTY